MVPFWTMVWLHTISRDFSPILVKRSRQVVARSFRVASASEIRTRPWLATLSPPSRAKRPKWVTTKFIGTPSSRPWTKRTYYIRLVPSPSRAKTAGTAVLNRAAVLGAWNSNSLNTRLSGYLCPQATAQRCDPEQARRGRVVYFLDSGTVMVCSGSVSPAARR